MRAAAARPAGFSLIELLVTLAILAIVMSLGTAGYRQYLQRANRVDATSALLRVAAAQEKFYAQNGQYADNAQLAAAPPAGLGITGTERGYYTLSVTPAPVAGGLAVGFTATATVDPGSNQRNDDGCRSFTINERGQRAAADDSGVSSVEATERCWK